MTRADSAAQEILKEFAVEQPPVDVFSIARALQIEVVQSTMPEGVSGMLIREGDAKTVGLHRQHSPRRKRFTLAHEIGHAQLHRGRALIVDSAVRVNLRDATSAQATDREEMEANRFAAALLMPADMITTAIERYSDRDPEVLPNTLATLFDVSTEAMGYRLINLGITT